MSERSGLGIIEIAVLDTLDRLGAIPGAEGVKSEAVLGQLERSFGIGPRYGYGVLCDLAQWWMVPLRLIDIVGNAGSLDSPPAGPSYTEARLSPTGALVVAAEREDGPPVPIRLINGNTYSGGSRPPFDGARLVRAITRLGKPPVADSELIHLVGAPAFPTGCEVSGPVDRLVDGEPTALHLSARLTQRPQGERTVIEMTNLPPGVGPWSLSTRLGALASPQSWSDREPELAERTRLPLKDLHVEGNDDSDLRLICVSEDDVGVDELERRLRDIAGVTIDLRTCLDAPLTSLLRAWVAAHGHDSVMAGLTALEALI